MALIGRVDKELSSWYLDLDEYMVSIAALCSFKMGLTSISLLHVIQEMNNDYVTVGTVAHSCYFVDLDSFSQ